MKRFGSKQVIISKHTEMLMQLPKLNISSDLKQIRQLLDKTEAAIRSLQGIGESSETYGTFLTPVIMAKIPQELRLILSRSMSDEWDLDTMMKSFAEELQIRKRCALGPVSEQTPKLGVKEKRDFGFGFRHGQIRGPHSFQTKKDHCRTKKGGVLFATALIHQTGVLLSLILRQRRTCSDRKDDVLVV